MIPGKVEICGVNTSKLPTLKPEERTRLMEQIKQGNREARETYIRGNLRLVLSVLKRFNGQGQNMDDLFQIGSIGLIKAIDKFDVMFDVKLSTYCVPMIMGEIKRFLRDDGIVKVSRNIKENGWKVKQATVRLQKELGREPTLEELSRESGLSREDIVVAMEAGSEVESIYQTIYQGDGNEICMIDKVVGGNGTVGRLGNCVGSSDDEKDRLINHMVLQQLIEELPPNERDIIKWRYFEDKTQTQVAEKLGISQVQVSRMEKKILMGMRKKM